MKTNNTNVSLYDSNTIHQIDWPDNEEGHFAKNYLLPLITNGISHYIDNINAKMGVLKIDEHLFPLLIVNNDYAQSYICSPFDHYVTMGKQEFETCQKPFIKKTVETCLDFLGRLLKKGKINQLVYVNHWLFSTDLYPKNITEKQILQLTSFLKDKFPKHAIAFRSLNDVTNKDLKQQLKKSKFKFIVTRPIHLTDTSDQTISKTRIIKSDLKLWREKDYEVLDGKEMTALERERILELYHKLVIENHSTLHPQFNKEFISLIIHNNLLTIKALRKNGWIQGVAGYFHHHPIFMCPFFGYDKNHEDKTKLYRLLSIFLFCEASESKKMFHQGAGASFYKSIRRATTHLEYLAVYSSHLPLKQKFAWNFLATIMNMAAIPYMRKNGPKL